VIDIVAF